MASLSESLGLVENKDEVVTSYDGSKTKTNTRPIALSGAAGTGLLGIESGNYLEAVTTPSGGSNRESSA